jgi:hypothetical protein
MPLETWEGAQFAQGVSQETGQMPISGVFGFAGKAGKLSSVPLEAVQSDVLCK